MYYLLKCPLEDSDATITYEPNLPPPLNLWNMGIKFDVPVPEPLQYSINEEDAGNLLPMINTGAHLLMQKKLIEVLHSSGVDNIDVYDAVIEELHTGTKYYDYQSVNIVGLIRAVDMSVSKGEDLGLIKNGLMTMWFDKLVINESKTHGALLFRLAEDIDCIILHESVKKNIENAGFQRLKFTVLDQI